MTGDQNSQVSGTPERSEEKSPVLVMGKEVSQEMGMLVKNGEGFPIDLIKGFEQACIDVLSHICPTLITTLDGTIISTNQLLLEVSGYAPEEILRKNIDTLLLRPYDAESGKDFKNTISTVGVWEGRFINKRKDDSLFYFHTIIQPIKDAGEIVGYLVVYNDITDAITGSIPQLPGYRELEQSLDKKNGKVLLLFHINELDNINYFYGKESGNEAIGILYRIIQEEISGKTKVSIYRSGGAEFAIVFEKKGDFQQFADNVSEKISGLVLDCGLPISLSASSIKTGGSSGNSIIAQCVSLLHECSNHQCKYVHDDPDRTVEDQERIRFINHIFQNDLIVPYGQLIYDRKGKATKLEALLRVRDGDMVIPPGEILGDISIFSGYRRMATRTMIEKTFAITKDSDVEISINVGTAEVNDPTFIDFVQEKLDKYKVEPDRVVFEILEEVHSLDDKKVVTFIGSLYRLGCKTAADDIGTNHAGLSSRLGLGTDYIKVDRSYVTGIDKEENEEHRIIVRKIIEISHETGKKVVVEGVETREEFEVLMSLGTDLFQGYYFHHPEPLEDLLKQGKI